MSELIKADNEYKEWILVQVYKKECDERKRNYEDYGGFSTDSIIAFGDDYADIGMLELCGTGVAMGNAIDEVKERADIVIGSNDEEGIADFIENEIL